MSDVVFLVPRRRDHGQRDKVWEYCRRRWERYLPDVPVVEGHHEDGPFNRSIAINRAAEQAGPWKVGIVIDSDVILSISQVEAAIVRAETKGRVTWAHRRWRGVREDATKRIIDDRHNRALDFDAELSRDEIDLIVERTNPLSWSCCFAMPRHVFDDMGGFDERFKGWGFEDMAFQSVIAGLYGHDRIEGDVVHLWHPRSDERITPGESRETATSEYVMNARLGRRYMVALRRDHKLHDRGDLPSTDEERERDIANLKRDDAKYDRVASRYGQPDWRDWWPTLPELIEGAKAARGAEPPSSVTLVLRTGGDPETWSDRSAYLRESIASLDARVTGPIVQRVVYSDWGPALRDELSAIVEPYGFYVVGPSRHVGYTEARRALWSYLATRSRGEYVFSVEDDFVYDRDVDLGPMIETMRSDPSLRQLALLRGPFYDREIEAGGVLASLRHDPDSVEVRNDRPWPYVVQRDHFTDNPSLFHRRLTTTPWPSGPSSERRFADVLLRDVNVAFGYWGKGESWITHIGTTRASTTGTY